MGRYGRTSRAETWGDMGEPAGPKHGEIWENQQGRNMGRYGRTSRAETWGDMGEPAGPKHGEIWENGRAETWGDMGEPAGPKHGEIWENQQGRNMGRYGRTSRAETWGDMGEPAGPKHGEELLAPQLGRHEDQHLRPPGPAGQLPAVLVPPVPVGPEQRDQPAELLLVDRPVAVRLPVLFDRQHLHPLRHPRRHHQPAALVVTAAAAVQDAAAAAAAAPADADLRTQPSEVSGGVLPSGWRAAVEVGSYRRGGKLPSRCQQRRGTNRQGRDVGAVARTCVAPGPLKSSSEKRVTAPAQVAVNSHVATAPSPGGM